MSLKLLGKDTNYVEMMYEKMRTRIEGENPDGSISVTNLITVDASKTDIYKLKDDVGVFLHKNKDSSIRFSTDENSSVELKNIFVENNILGVVVDVPRDKFGK